MAKIIIAVGSKRGPKLNAVRDALGSFGASLSPGCNEFELVGFEVDSGVSHTPASREEIMRGAQQRAEALVQIPRESGAQWDFFVGLEGGLDVLYGGASPDKALQHPDLVNRPRRVFLESWAYVSDGREGHYGCSGAIELPDALAGEVLENGTELAVAIDRFAGAVGIRDAQGAWGVLSNELITRQEAFRVAVVAAFAPFYNRKMYQADAVSASGSAL